MWAVNRMTVQWVNMPAYLDFVFNKVYGEDMYPRVIGDSIISEAEWIVANHYEPEDADLFSDSVAVSEAAQLWFEFSEDNSYEKEHSWITEPRRGQNWLSNLQRKCNRIAYAISIRIPGHPNRKLYNEVDIGGPAANV